MTNKKSKNTTPSKTKKIVVKGRNKEAPAIMPCTAYYT